MEKPTYAGMIKEIYESSSIRWKKISKRTKTIITILLVIYISYVVYDFMWGPAYFSLFYGATYLGIIIPLGGAFLMLGSFATKENPIAYAMWLIGLSMLILAQKQSSWIFVLMVGYLSYYLFEIRRQKRIIYFANKTPGEIAKIKKGKGKLEPTVEITVRGEE